MFLAAVNLEPGMGGAQGAARAPAGLRAAPGRRRPHLRRADLPPARGPGSETHGLRATVSNTINRIWIRLEFCQV